MFFFNRTELVTIDVFVVHPEVDLRVVIFGSISVKGATVSISPPCSAS